MESPQKGALEASLSRVAASIYGPEVGEICGLLSSLVGSCDMLGKVQGLGGSRQAAAAVIIMAGAASHRQSSPGQLSAVLAACGLTLECAVRELSPAAAILEPALASVLGGDVPLERRLQLRELKQSFVFNTLLAKKTRDLYAEYFSLPPDPSLSSPLGFLWLLFCTARAALLPPQADLVTSFSLLLACTHFMLCHVPHQLIKADRQPLLLQEQQGQQQNGNQQQQQPQQEQKQSGAADELLMAVAASHSAAEHATTVRQLAGLLQTLLCEVLQPVVAAVPLAPSPAVQLPPESAVAYPANGAAAQEGEQPQQPQQPQRAPEPAALLPSVWASFPGLFDAEGRAVTAAVEALHGRYQKLTADADIDPIPFLVPTPVPMPSAAPANVAPSGGAGNVASPATGTATDADRSAVAGETRLAPGAAVEAPAGPSGQAGAAASTPPTAAASVAAGQRDSVGGEAAMDVDGEPQPTIAECQGAFARTQAAGGIEEPGSPVAGRQMNEPVATTPLRAVRVAGHAAAEPEGDGGLVAPAASAYGIEGGAALPDASYRTPSPPRQRQGPPPLPKATPISAAMTSTAWLQAALAGQGGAPSQTLRALMRTAGVDADGEARLATVAEGLAKAVLPDCTAPLEGPLLALEQSSIAARRSQGLRLYWRVLEGLVAAEAARPDSGPATAGALLGSLLFHRCVAACAFECVISSYRMVNLGFPAVLERLHVPAFDLCKAVEPFVQQLASMPRDMKRHMWSVEEKCLESLAWQQGSSLYPTLIAALGGTSHVSGSAMGSAASGGADTASDAPGTGASVGSQHQHQQHHHQHQHQQQQQPNQQPGSPASANGAAISNSCGGDRAAAGGVTPRKRGRAEMAAPGGGEVDADMADVPPHQTGGTPAAGTAGSAGPLGGHLELNGRLQQQQAQHQQFYQQRNQQNDVTSSAVLLPLSVGSPEALQATPATRGDSGDQQQASADGKGSQRVLGGDRSARSAVGEFLRRVLKLAAIRLADLLSRLDTQPADPQLLHTQAFTLAHRVAYEHTWLMYGRHLDQILLCCLYSVCKFHQLPQASFKAIIAAYHQQPQAQAETFKSVSMRPRERTSLHQLQPEAPADIIAFYNQVFIPHTRPLLLRLTEDRGQLVQPPPSVLPFLLPQLQRAQPSSTQLGITSPTCLPLWGAHPASLQTPWLPVLGVGHLGSPIPRGLAGTPTPGGGSSGGVASVLLSPGSWRINRGGMAPLASPSAERMAALQMAGSPAVLKGARSQPSTPLSPAAYRSLLGTSGTARGTQGLAHLQTSPPAFSAAARAAAAAAAAGGVALPFLMPPAPLAPPRVPRPSVSDTAVQHMFAQAEAAAAAAAVAVAQVNVAERAQQGQQRPQPRQAQRREADRGIEQFTQLPAENLPLLAAAAVVAEEIERKEGELAAAFSSRQASQPTRHTPAAPPQLGNYQQHPVQEAAAAGPLAGQQAARGAAIPPAAAAAAAAPGLPQVQALAAPVPSPRRARRILSLQPAPAPVQ